MNKLIERLRKAADWGEADFDVLSPQDAETAATALETLTRERDEARAEVERLSEAQRFTLSDCQRLLRKSDVEGICRSPDLCWEYGDTARCGPCAIEQASALGVETDHSLPNLPEVYRQKRENDTLRAQLTATQARLNEAVRVIRIFNPAVARAFLAKHT